MNRLQVIMLYGFLSIVTILSMFLIWKTSRLWNYNLSYKGMVKQTVVDMVKVEALKVTP